MINVRELKIGNYVECPLEGIKKITSGQEIDTILEKEFMPVHLSEDILAKCHFADSGNDNTGKYFRHPRTSIAIALKDGIYFFRYWEKIGDFTLRSKVTVDIEYLHQLQNLYYCLTGQELEVNL